MSLDSSASSSTTGVMALQPHAEGTTNIPAGTFIPAKLPAGEGALMYWPEQNAFLALFAPEFNALHFQADEHSKKIAALQEANKKVTEAAVVLRAAQKANVAADMKKAEDELNKALNEMQQASDEVKKKLEPLDKLDAKGGNKMIELVSLKAGRYDKKDKGVPIYVTSDKIKKVLAEKRLYLVESEKAKREKDKIFKDGKLNTKEIKHRIAEKAQSKDFKKEWKLKPDDADEYTGVLSEWARTMNGDIAKFIERNTDDLQKKFNHDPKDEHRNIDLSVDAQLMRYTAGAGLAVNFKPFQGNLFDQRDRNWPSRIKRGLMSADCGIKANAKAAFAVAEGRVHTELYLPHYAGWHATAELAGQTVEFGYWRLYGDIILSGSVGASVAVELGIEVSLTGGKQGIRGIPPANKKKSGAKARVGASGDLDAFAGARAGLDAKGALQWLNPEGAESNGKPLKVKPGKAIAEYKDMAKIDTGVAGTAGIGVRGAFAIKHEEGKFVIYAKIGACLGLGGEGSLKFEAGTATIGEFFKCVAYHLKRLDYHKLGDAIEQDAYEAYCKVKYMVVAGGRRLEQFVDEQLDTIEKEFDSTIKKIDRALKDGTNEAKEFLNRIRHELELETASWLSYAPPEVMGQITRQIAAAGLSPDAAISGEAPRLMAMALGAPQTLNHLNTVAERMTLAMGDKQSEATGMAMIQACLADSVYSSSLNAAQQRLADAQPLLSQPFIWNSEPEFQTASLAIEHSMFA
ncbi:hypothetical protein GTP58_14445 [Duganella sp. CY15W]|uniref:hypothetical protein n=1 Tax=Duganella sp. CY15W TaxID=2692172 RepID=UPI00136A1534|nr:hypothetical protein [Duganella sp. CY15W]MYM29526.1 hypothetical protein [Duganella sp. CY15W]